MARPRGRPAKEADEVKSATLSVRLRPHLRYELKSSARGRNITISEEVERRMMETFADDEMRNILMDSTVYCAHTSKHLVSVKA